MESSTFDPGLPGSSVSSTAARVLLAGCGVNGVERAGDPGGWVPARPLTCGRELGGALLGPEESGAGTWMGARFAGFFVVVWLLDSGREHLCSCLLRSISLIAWGRPLLGLALLWLG